MDSPPAELVEAAAAGDRSAFGAVVEHSWSRLVRLARSVVGEAEAEDVVQESLMVAWNKLPTLRDRERFGAWAGRIVFRRSLRRARRRPHLIDLAEVPEASYSPDPASRLTASQLLARLAPRQRAVLHLTAVEGMSDGEIGVVLGITPGSVRAHRRRARERITVILRGGARG